MDPPTLLSPTLHFTPTATSRSPSRSPTRPRITDDILSDLSPAVTLEQFTSASGSLRSSIEAASPTQRAFGIRAAIASKKIQEWLTELSAWPWPESGSDGFELPATKRRKLQSESASPNAESGADDEVYWGSLPEKTVLQYESRIDEILEDMDDLDVEEIKTQVLNTHLQSRSRPSSSHNVNAHPAPSLASYTKMDDFTAIITATVLQSLPNLSRLMALMDVWSVRLSILHEVPPLLLALDDVEIELKSGWKAFEPNDENTPGVSSASNLPENPPSSSISRERFVALRGILQEKVTRLGQKLDHMLDTLVGREDTIPEIWLDRMEVIEQDYGEWVVCGDRIVREGEWAKQKAEQERLRRIEEERLRREEEERARRQEEERLRLEEEARLRRAEEERLRLEEEERLRREEEERLRLEEEERLRLEEEERLRIEEEERQRRIEEEERLRQEEEERLRREAEAARLRKEEEERLRREEEERVRLEEEERLRKEEAERLRREEGERLRKEEEERLRKEEEERLRKEEEERLRKEEEERLRKEEEARVLREEQDRVWREEQERLRQAEEERLRNEELERQRIEEENRRMEEAERLRLIEEDRLRAEQEQLRLAEEERLRAEQEQRRLAEQERLLEIKRLQEAEEARLRVEQEQRRAEQERLLEIKRLKEAEEERLRAEQERLRIAEEERFLAEKEKLRLESEEKLRQEEERLRREEPLRLQMEQDALRAQELELAKLEEENLHPDSNTSEIEIASSQANHFDGIVEEDHNDETIVVNPSNDLSKEPKELLSVETNESQSTMPTRPEIILPDGFSSNPLPEEEDMAAANLDRDPVETSKGHGHSRMSSYTSTVTGYAASDPSPKIFEAEPTEYFRPVLSPNTDDSNDGPDLVTPTETSLTVDQQEPFDLYGVQEQVGSPVLSDFQGEHRALDVLSEDDELELSGSSHATPNKSESKDENKKARRSSVISNRVASPVLKEIVIRRRSSTSSTSTIIHERSQSTVMTPSKVSSPVDGHTPNSPLEPDEKDLSLPHLQEDSPSIGWPRVYRQADSYSPPSSPPAAPTSTNLHALKVSTGNPQANNLLSPDSPTTPVEPPFLDNVDVSPAPLLASPGKTSDDQLQQQISEILESIPAKIRLTSEPEIEPALQVKKRRSLSAVLRPMSRAATPSFTLAPAYRKNPRPRPQNGNPEIKLYHLSRSTGEAPIKLFVRLVGERGERVMVRVGGGWADLGEYLKEYASHHGRRTDKDGKVEVQDMSPRLLSGGSLSSFGFGNGRSSPSSRPGSALDRRPSSSLAIRKTRRSIGEDSREQAPKSPRSPTTPMSFTSSTLRAMGPTDFSSPPSASSATSRSSSRLSWAPEASVRGDEPELGLAGPKGRKVEMSAENAAWVESMKEKVRQASAEKEKRTDFGNLGKVGGTKRLFRKSLQQD